MALRERIVITGVGLTAPNADNLPDFRQALLTQKSGVQWFETRHLGKVLAGVCHFDEFLYQKKKERRRGTRAGSIAIYCGNEALKDARLDIPNDPSVSGHTSRIGVYLGITEHGNVETENEVWNLQQFENDPQYWSHHHNPRTVANNPAGELCLNRGLTGPHLCLGAACAAGNCGLIHGAQMLMLDEIDVALCGGVSESIHTFGIFASFASQGALGKNINPTQASRPFDKERNGIVASEGGCVFVVEKLSRALERGAKIYGELAGYASNTDATDFVLPNANRQAECMRAALHKADLQPADINIVNAHATATPLGDTQEADAINRVFGDFESVHINATKGFIGHCMGAAGALEIAGNLPSFADGLIHPTMNFTGFDENCRVRNLVHGEPKAIENINYIMNLSSGMLGINTAVILKKFELEKTP